MEYLCDSGAGTMKPGMPTDGTFRHHTHDGLDLGQLEDRSVRRTHCGVGGFVGQDRSAPPAGTRGAARLRDADRLRVGRHIARVSAAVTPWWSIGAGGIGTAAIQGARIDGRRPIIVAVDPDRVQTRLRDRVRRHPHDATARDGDRPGARAHPRGDGRRVVRRLRRRSTKTTSGRRSPSPARAAPACSPDWRRRRRRRRRSARRAAVRADEQDPARHRIRILQPEERHPRAGRLYESGRCNSTRW